MPVIVDAPAALFGSAQMSCFLFGSVSVLGPVIVGVIAPEIVAGIGKLLRSRRIGTDENYAVVLPKYSVLPQGDAFGPMPWLRLAAKLPMRHLQTYPWSPCCLLFFRRFSSIRRVADSVTSRFVGTPRLVISVLASGRLYEGRHGEAVLRLSV